ncbi:ABC transporter ATP-binding protein [Rhodospira trueperi]|uniref:ABC transporter ATP-binding protein n=1 Tax=Rhodospira trueperi TaxID=69960 RepID=UPI0015A35AA5|nr:ABC transporter ATP-binding protein [Rhodospira trueperi]
MSDPGRLLPVLARYKGKVAATLLLSAVASLLALGPWVILAVLVGAVEAGTLTGSLAMILSGAAAGIVLLRFAALAGGSALAHLVAFDMLRDLRFALLGRLEVAPMARVIGEGRGALVKIIRDDVERLERLVAHAIPDLVAALVPGLFSVVLLAVLDWRFALIAVAPLVGAAILVRVFLLTPANTALAEQLGALQERVSARLIEFVRGQPVLRMIGSPWGRTAESAAPDRLIGEVHAFEWAWARKGLCPHGLSQVLLGGTTFLAVGLGLWAVQEGGATLRDYVLLICLAPALVTPLEKVQHTLHEIMEMGPGIRRIAEVLGWAGPPYEEPLRRAVACAHPVRFEAVSCSIDGHPVLKGLSFTLPAEGLTAIVGASGAGKTTVVRILARLLDPDGGRVRVADADLADRRPDDWYAFAIFAFQGTFLSRDTVADNLRVARPEASDDDLRRALWAACCLDVIDALPDGLETRLGGDGVTLSGGQSQRLCLARALLRDAPLLVLDEATSHADPVLERALLERLRTYRAGRATVFVTHRLPSAAVADHILVLEAGTLRGQGTHAHLLEACPAYRRLSDARRGAAA